MLKRIALALAALVVMAGTLPALAADPSPAVQAPLRVLATRTVRAGRHSLGLFFFLVAAAVVVWLVLRWRAARLGYLHDGGQYTPGAQRTYGPPGYPGGYMPGGPGVMGGAAAGLPASAGIAPAVEIPPVADPGAGSGGSVPGEAGGHGEPT